MNTSCGYFESDGTSFQDPIVGNIKVQRQENSRERQKIELHSGLKARENRAPRNTGSVTIAGFRGVYYFAAFHYIVAGL